MFSQLIVPQQNRKLFDSLNWGISDPDPLVSASVSELGKFLSGDQPVTSPSVIFNADGVAEVLYQAPESFIRKDKEKLDKDSPERYIQITFNNHPEGLPAIRVKRPPLVLVHGTWSTPAETWDEFKQIVTGNDDKYFVWTADYSKPPYSNVGSLATNYPAIPKAIAKALSLALSDDLAATKVDVIAHSLGGLVTREYCYMSSSDCSNSIRKIITLDSTHLGTELAKVFTDHRKLVNFAQFLMKVAKVFGASFQDIDGQALDDQVPNSDALIILAQNPPPVPMHKIAGKTPDQMYGYVDKITGLWSILKSYFRLIPDTSFPTSVTYTRPFDKSFTFNYAPVFQSYNDQDLGRNDRIVSIRSQKNGTSNNTSVFENVDHTTIHGDPAIQIAPEIITCINQLLDAKDTDAIWTNGCQ
jgi:triacylglycerol esterase/lipase EstA (alpha/beta hydrolase family)